MARIGTTTKVIPVNKTVRGRRQRTKVTVKHRLNFLRKMLSQNTLEFCRNTTLHGLGYIGRENIYPIEKGFFALAFIIVLFLFVFFMMQVFAKWSTTPVIYGLNPKPSFIMKEPFPAITICNLNKAYKEMASQVPINTPEYAMLNVLCKNDDFANIGNTTTDWSQLPGFVRNISQPCSKMLIACKYGSVKYNCSELFQPVITDEGLCCAFNMVHSSFVFVDGLADPLKEDEHEFVAVDWSAETGYPKNLPKKYYPRPAAGTGESLGLSLTLDVESDSYYCSSMNSIGFKMLVHNPTESPSLSEIGLLLAAGRETKVRIRAENTDSEQYLKGVNMRDRKCAFENELRPIIFKRYTQHNCHWECLGGLMLDICGCLLHFMVKLRGDMATCGMFDAECVKNVRISSMISGSPCNRKCLPGCYDLTYRPDFFSTPLSHDGFHIVNQMVNNISNEYVEQNIAIVHIYNKMNTFRSTKQTEFIGFTDFLSSVGGLIGLFFGFSFISLAEIFFYIFIRPCRTVRLVKQTAVVNAKTKKPLGPRRQRFQNPFKVEHGHSTSFLTKA